MIHRLSKKLICGLKETDSFYRKRKKLNTEVIWDDHYDVIEKYM